MGLDLKNMMQEVHWSHNAWQRVSTLHTTHREETKTQKTPVDHTCGIWPENKCCYASVHTCLPETQLETHQTSRILFKCKIFMEICHRDCQQIFSGIILSIFQSSVKPICKNFETATQQKGLRFFLFLNERIHNDQKKCWEVYWFRKLCQWIRHQLIAKIQNPRMLCVQWGVNLIWGFVNWIYNLNKFKKSVLHLNRLRKNTDQTIETVKQSKRFFKRNL